MSRDSRGRHISDQPERVHDIQHENTGESFRVTGWVSKEPTKELIKSFTRPQSRELDAAHNSIRLRTGPLVFLCSPFSSTVTLMGLAS